MNKKFILVLLIISVAINLATVVTFIYYWSHERVSVTAIGPRTPERFPEWHGSRLERELKLTESQLREIKKVNDEMRESMKPIHDGLFRKRHELMLVLQDIQPDTEEANARIKEIVALQAEHDTRMFSALLRIKRILTPEQRSKLGMLINRLIAPEGPGPLLHQHPESYQGPGPRPEPPPPPYKGR